ncbi:MAG: hypothetical protein SFT68_00050, partial [Rickettsiaceae bacterium]|nr:hypothetical protein [Rickettsiaceae bacterium]
ITIHIVGNLGPNNKQVRIQILDTTTNAVNSTEYYNLSTFSSYYKISCSDATSNLYGLNFLYMDTVDASSISVRIRQGVADYLWAGLTDIRSQISTRLSEMNDNKFAIRQKVNLAKDALQKLIQTTAKNATADIGYINQSAADIIALEQLTLQNNYRK